MIKEDPHFDSVYPETIKSYKRYFKELGSRGV